MLALLEAHSIPPPKDSKGNPVEITRTYLGGLCESSSTRVIGALKSQAYPYTIYALQNKAEMIKESTILKHCVGNSDYYIEKVLRKEILVLSLRNASGTPFWTIEYNIKDRTINQFK